MNHDFLTFGYQMCRLPTFGLDGRFYPVQIVLSAAKNISLVLFSLQE
jgi:hypothetical protein